MIVKQIIIILICLVLNGELRLEPEICKAQQLVGNTTIDWVYDDKSKLYYGNPHCLDAQNKYVTRTCLPEGVFEEEPYCASAQQPISNCPRNFIEQDKYCITILAEATYDESKCPYNNVVAFDGSLIAEELVWYPGKRSTDSSIGEFMVHELSATYGEQFTETFEYLTINITESDCIIFNGSTKKYYAVSCNNKYKRICVYKHLDKNDNSYCKSDENCIDYDFDATTLKCICISGSSNCEHAELIYPYQNSIRSRKLNGCKIGLREENGIIIWDSGDIPTYTFWSPAPKKLIQGQFILSENGWTGGTVSCAICVRNVFYEEPIMSMMHNDNRQIFDVHIENYQSIINIFCFTNSQSNALKTKILPSGSNGVYEVQITESGLYWCELYDMISFNISKTKKVWVFTDEVFVVNVTFLYEKEEDPTHNSIAYGKYIKTIQDIFTIYNYKIKWMDTTYIDYSKQLVTYLIHINSKFMGHRGHLEMLNIIKTQYLPKLSLIDSLKNTSDVSSTLYCLTFTEIICDIKIVWPTTEIHHSAKADPHCVDDFGYERWRKCLGDNVTGARWENLPRCKVADTQTSEDLINLLNNPNTSNVEIIDGLLRITQNTSQFASVDVHMVSSILDKLEPGEGVAEDVASIIDNVMTINPHILKESQDALNATDIILNTFDNILEANKMFENETLVETKHVITFFFDGNHSDNCGIALLGTDDTGYKAQPLKKHKNLETILQDDQLDLVAYIPPSLMQDLNDSKIIITIFISPALFIDSENSKVISKSLGILINNPGHNLTKNILILFKAKEQKLSCGFWQYGFKDGKPIKGKWYIENESRKENHALHECQFDHVTHFGLLLSDEIIVEDSDVLDLITNIECIFSIFGFIGIFATAVLFKAWRTNAGNKILIHYSVLSLLQIALLYTSNFVHLSSNFCFCVVFGAALHYTVLSQFCWMLVMAYLQYRRYVTVFFGMRKWLMTKFYITSYALPSIPVLAIMIFFKANYVKGNTPICYPSGDGLLYTVLLPIGLISCANIAIFIRIAMEMFCCRSNKCIDDGIFLLRLRLVVLMFFMLGVTWGFGIAAHIFEDEFLVYVFCVSAPIQGFVIFLFFIVLNENTRIMYMYLWRKYKKCP